MTIALDRFCINRKIAPNLDLDSFFRLVKRCGLSKVELRNDMPSGKVTDDLSDAQLNALAAQYGIEIVTINALGMFNLMDNPAALQQRAEALLAQAQAICVRRGVRFASEEFYRIDATACDSELQQCWQAAVEQVQGRSLALPSGAGHDAIAVAAHWPVGMLFVRCAGGVSHHPAEAVRQADVALAIQAYCLTIAGWEKGESV